MIKITFTSSRYINYKSSSTFENDDDGRRAALYYISSMLNAGFDVDSVDHNYEQPKPLKLELVQDEGQQVTEYARYNEQRDYDLMLGEIKDREIYGHISARGAPATLAGHGMDTQQFVDFMDEVYPVKPWQR